MVKMFNIKKKNNTISCNYTPETSNEQGYIEVDVATHEIKKIDYSAYEYGKKMYVAHVRSKLSELLNSKGDIPKEALVVWY
ncbi:MAG: hypothetical protein LUF33_03650 [Clostridiales bacterium]|nr:hypothetical protein [Clostridiales bacterium]